MKNHYFQALETSNKGQIFPLKEMLENLAFNQRGLIPVITQDVDTQEVLMMAWMNADAITKTLNTGRVTYWSRSRESFWVKGETSGHTQDLISLAIDCDGDALLCRVKQKGAACHTGRKNCFYFEVLPGEEFAMLKQRS